MVGLLCQKYQNIDTFFINHFEDPTKIHTLETVASSVRNIFISCPLLKNLLDLKTVTGFEHYENKHGLTFPFSAIKSSFLKGDLSHRFGFAYKPIHTLKSWWKFSQKK